MLSNHSQRQAEFRKRVENSSRGCVGGGAVFKVLVRNKIGSRKSSLSNRLMYLKGLSDARTLLHFPTFHHSAIISIGNNNIVLIKIMLFLGTSQHYNQVQQGKKQQSDNQTGCKQSSSLFRLSWCIHFQFYLQINYVKSEFNLASYVTSVCNKMFCNLITYCLHWKQYMTVSWSNV